jgi:very-short-patch-repair endonuclease
MVCSPYEYGYKKEILHKIFLLQNNSDNKVKRQLRKILDIDKLESGPVSYDSLRAHYYDVSSSCSDNYKHLVTRSTEERIFCEKLGRRTKLQFRTNYWAGNFNMDLFFPQHRLSIEIDSPAHNGIDVMKKDNHKEDFLMNEFKIMTARIENGDLNRQLYKTILPALSEAKYRGTRDQRNLFSSIFISTLVTPLLIGRT